MNLSEYIKDYGKKHDFISESPIDILLEQSTDVFDVLFKGGFSLGSFLAKMAKNHFKKKFTKAGRKATEKADIEHRLEMAKSRKELKSIMGDLDSVLGDEDKKTQAQLVDNIKKNEKKIAKTVKKQDKADKKVKDATDKLKADKGNSALKDALKKAKEAQTAVTKEANDIIKPKPSSDTKDNPDEPDDTTTEPDEVDSKIDSADVDDDKKAETKAIKSEIDAIKKEKDPEKRAELIANAKDHLAKANKKFGGKVSDTPDDEEESDVDEPTTKKDIKKAIERTTEKSTKWQAELKTTKAKSARGKQLQQQVDRSNKRVTKLNKELKKLGEGNISFKDCFKSCLFEAKDELADLEKELAKLEGKKPKKSKKSKAPKKKPSKEKQPADVPEEDVDVPEEDVDVPEEELDPTAEVDPNAEVDPTAIAEEGVVTSQPVDPMTGQAKPEPPEELDISLKPFQQKQNMIITLLKEYGYSVFDIKIEDGKNVLVLKGEIDKSLKKNIQKLSKELEISVNFDVAKIDEDKFQTKLMFTNNADLAKFKDIYKIIKRNAGERKAAEMGGM